MPTREIRPPGPRRRDLPQAPEDHTGAQEPRAAPAEGLLGGCPSGPHPSSERRVLGGDLASPVWSVSGLQGLAPGLTLTMLTAPPPSWASFSPGFERPQVAAAQPPPLLLLQRLRPFPLVQASPSRSLRVWVPSQDRPPKAHAGLFYSPPPSQNLTGAPPHKRSTSPILWVPRSPPSQLWWLHLPNVWAKPRTD